MDIKSESGMSGGSIKAETNLSKASQTRDRIKFSSFFCHRRTLILSKQKFSPSLTRVLLRKNKVLLALASLTVYGENMAKNLYLKIFVCIS